MWGGCTESTSPTVNGVLSMSSKYTTQTVLAKSSTGAAVDSVVISRARLVLRDIKFKSPSEDSTSFRTAPMVLELSLSGGVQEVGVVTVKPGTFQRIEFDVHRVEAPEIASLPAADQTQFADFLAGERYSIVVDGTVFQSGLAPAAFTYRSKVDAKQKIDLVDPLVIDAATLSVNATLVISSANWFKSASGTLVDPSDPNNEGVIDENLKASIKVFKDNNRDGSKD